MSGGVEGLRGEIPVSPSDPFNLLKEEKNSEQHD